MGSDLGGFLAIFDDFSEDTRWGNHTFGASCYITLFAFSASCYITFPNILTFERILLHHFHRHMSIFGQNSTAVLVKPHDFRHILRLSVVPGTRELCQGNPL